MAKNDEPFGPQVLASVTNALWAVMLHSNSYNRGAINQPAGKEAEQLINARLAASSRNLLRARSVPDLGQTARFFPFQFEQEVLRKLAVLYEPPDIPFPFD